MESTLKKVPFGYELETENEAGKSHLFLKDEQYEALRTLIVKEIYGQHAEYIPPVKNKENE